jgi:hypothetical protein
LVNWLHFIFLGYTNEHWSYECYDPVGRRMGISCDVIFYEPR